MMMKQETTGSDTTEVPMEGGAFVAEIAAKAAFTVADNTAITLDLGYRLANVAEIKASKDIDSMNIKKGDVMKDADDAAIPADYSGLIANIGVKFGF